MSKLEEYHCPLSSAGGEGQKGEVPTAFPPWFFPTKDAKRHLFPGEVSSIPKNSQTPILCSVLITLSFVFPAVSLTSELFCH